MIQGKFDRLMQRLSRRKREKAAKDDRLYKESERSLFSNFKDLPLEKQKKLVEKNSLLASFAEREGGRTNDRV